MKYLFIVLLLVSTFFGGLYLGEAGSLNLFGLSSNDSMMQSSGESMEKMEKKGSGSYDEGYQAGVDFARTRLAEIGFLPSNDSPVAMMDGTVKSVSGNAVTLEFEAINLDPLIEGKVTKQVTVESAVGVEKHIQRDGDDLEKEILEYEKALEAFFKKLESNPGGELGDEPKQPLPYTIEKLAASDLKEGDLIRVMTDGDFKASDSVAANQVILLAEVQPVSPAEAQPASGTEEVPSE